MGKHQTIIKEVVAAAYGVLVDVHATRIDGVGVQVVFAGWHSEQSAAKAMLPEIQQRHPGALCWLVSKGPPSRDGCIYGLLVKSNCDDAHLFEGWYGDQALANARLPVLQRVLQKYPDMHDAPVWLIERINNSDEVAANAKASRPPKQPKPKETKAQREQREASLRKNWEEFEAACARREQEAGAEQEFGPYSDIATALAQLEQLRQQHPSAQVRLVGAEKELIVEFKAAKEPEKEQAKQEQSKANKPVLTLAEWAARDLPPPDFICGQWLTTTSRVLLFADTGIGKTLLAMAIGMAAAAGKPCLHWRGVRPTKVLYIDGEMSRPLLKQRLADEAQRLGVAPTTFLALSKEDAAALEPLNTPHGRAYMEHVLQKYCDDVDLIIFDNIMALIEGDQKDEEGWRQTLPWIRTLTQRSIGQLWVHHTGHDTTRSYGTKTREWQMDTVISLEQVERMDTDVSFQLKFGKARERTPATRADYTDVNVALVNNAWTWELQSGVRPKKVSPLGTKFFEALCIATAASGAQFNGHPAAAIEDWRKVCIKCGLLDPVGNPRSARSLFDKSKRDLIAANWIACDATMAWTIARNPHAGPL